VSIDASAPCAVVMSVICTVGVLVPLMMAVPSTAVTPACWSN